jgi:hypothetical protein
LRAGEHDVDGRVDDVERDDEQRRAVGRRQRRRRDAAQEKVAGNVALLARREIALPAR